MTNQEFFGVRMPSGQQPTKVHRIDGTLEAEFSRERTDPSALRLAVSRVVVLRGGSHLAHVVLRRTSPEPSDIQHQDVYARGEPQDETALDLASRRALDPLTAETPLLIATSTLRMRPAGQQRTARLRRAPASQLRTW